MKINRNKLRDIGIAIGTALGYITIIAGIIMTIFLLETIYSGT